MASSAGAHGRGGGDRKVPSPGGGERRRLLCTDLELGERQQPQKPGGCFPHADCNKAVKEGGKLKLPTEMQVMDAAGKVKNVQVSTGEIVACFGLPPPPGGWYGPFGFFRLVSYAFGAVAVFGALAVLISMATLDVFGAFAAALLTCGAVVGGYAAYAHEGLADEVTEMANQNREFTKKNDKLAAQIKELGGIADKMETIQKHLGVSADQLENTLDTLHRQTSLQQLTAMLSAFTDADQDGDKNQRLTKTEVEDFFDSSSAILKGACPTFDFDKLKKLCLKVGIGLYAMRFMVNALIASGDDNPHKSSAELSLIMFCDDPEHHLERCLASLVLVMGKEHEARLRNTLLAKKALARSEEGGRIPCKELHDVSHEIMTFERNTALSSTAASTTTTPLTSPTAAA